MYHMNFEALIFPYWLLFAILIGDEGIDEELEGEDNKDPEDQG
jgi:hypothetical protein